MTDVTEPQRTETAPTQAAAGLLTAKAERLEAEALLAQTLADAAAKRAREARTAPAPGRR